MASVEQLSATNSGSRHRARLLAGLPVIERRLQVAGVSTAVLEGGAGPPIVLLHGPGDFAGMWMRIIPDLVTTHRVIAPDLPGHGTSEPVDGRRTQTACGRGSAASSNAHARRRRSSSATCWAAQSAHGSP